MKQDYKNWIEWYGRNQLLYKTLAKKVESIIIELMELKKIDYHVTYSRGKEIDSFAKKISKKEYEDPIKEITDLAGIRVITYVETQITPIREIVEENFDIDWGNSSDKSEELGIDKVGYKSVHYIAQLKKDRLKLPEYQRFKKLNFEIQIRTILQHAWAEIEHDRNYKFTGVLPKEIQRRFKLLAGLLETADSEFNSISIAIDKISGEINMEAKKGNLDIPINSTSLKEFLPIRFKEIIGHGLDPTFPSSEGEILVINELLKFGITTLKDLDNIIPGDYIKHSKSMNQTNNYVGLLRDIMILSDYEKYFTKVWKKDSWSAITKRDKDFLEKISNIPIEKISKKYGLKIML